MRFDEKKRKKPDVTVNFSNNEAKNLIQKWLHRYAISVNSFADVLDLAGITGDTIEISTADSEDNTSIAQTGNHKYILRLLYVDSNYCAHVYPLNVTIETADMIEIREYEVSKFEGELQVILRAKAITTADTTYSSYYNRGSFCKSIETSDLKLRFLIDEFNGDFRPLPIMHPKADDAIEEYFSSLDISALKNLEEVWKKTRAILDYTNSDIEACLIISFDLTSVHNNRVLAKYDLHHGILTEYAENNGNGASLLVSAETYKYTFKDENFEICISGNGSN